MFRNIILLKDYLKNAVSLRVCSFQLNRNCNSRLNFSNTNCQWDRQIKLDLSYNLLPKVNTQCKCDKSTFEFLNIHWSISINQFYLVWFFVSLKRNQSCTFCYWPCAPWRSRTVDWNTFIGNFFLLMLLMLTTAVLLASKVYKFQNKLNEFDQA